MWHSDGFKAESCSYLATANNREYKLINKGDSKADVIAQLGIPSTKTQTNEPFPRVGSGCELPCIERFWYENRLFLDIEAWSVDFDANDRVLEKYHWTSP